MKIVLIILIVVLVFAINMWWILRLLQLNSQLEEKLEKARKDEIALLNMIRKNNKNRKKD